MIVLINLIHVGFLGYYLIMIEFSDLIFAKSVLIELENLISCIWYWLNEYTKVETFTLDILYWRIKKS
jgi:hypothetical protein